MNRREEPYFAHKEIHFARKEKVFAHEEKYFVHKEKLFAHREKVFAHKEKRFAHKENLSGSVLKRCPNKKNEYYDNKKRTLRSLKRTAIQGVYAKLTGLRLQEKNRVEHTHRQV